MWLLSDITVLIHKNLLVARKKGGGGIVILLLGFGFDQMLFSKVHAG